MAGSRDDGTFAEDRAHHPNRKVGRNIRMPWGDDHRMGNITERIWDNYEGDPYNDDEVLNLSYQGIDPAEIIENKK
jgi:hypothetical protein